MFNKANFLTQFNEMCLPNDCPVIVHASLRAVGKIDGGGQTLLDALIEHVTLAGGVLCVPTHTWNNFENKNDIILDLTDSTTCVGTLSNIAAADKRAVRTLNPTHSVVVFGNKDKVEEFIAQENQALTPTSLQGCYGSLYRQNGKVLLIGVGQEKNTYLHCVEEMLGITNRLSVQPVQMRIKDKKQKVFEKPFYYMTEEICDVSLYFPKYEPAFRYHGAIVDGKIGNANVQLCDAVLMKRVMELIRSRSNGQELLFDDIPIDEKFYN